MNEILEKAKPGGLGFDGRSDAFDHIRHLVKYGNNWLAANNFDISYRYEHAEFDVHVWVNTPSDVRERHLIFRAIPYGGPAAREQVVEDRVVRIPMNVSSAHATDSRDNGQDEFVLVGITNLVERPQKIIPSSIWLARNHQVKDAFRYIPGPTLRAAFALGVGKCSAEGEMSMVPAVGVSRLSDREASPVQCRSQVRRHIKSDVGEKFWHGLTQANFVELLASIRIALNETGVWVVVDESGDLGLQLCKVSLGIRELARGIWTER
jgi:hypothetical protein